MPEFDLPLEKLQVYRPSLTRTADFNSFWKETLSQLEKEDLDPRLEPVEYPAGQARVFRAHFRGWGGSPLEGWYIVPPGDGPFPGLVEYHGYSGMSAEPNTFFQWTLQGYAVLGIDVRGQLGGSADTQTYSGGHAPGWMTQGILSPETYYYRAVYADTVSALNFMRSRAEVDKRRLGVMGVHVRFGANKGG